MGERQPATLKRLLDRLLATRARRDREERFSEPWHAADAELHAIERAIFRVPVDATAPSSTRAGGRCFVTATRGASRPFGHRAPG